MREKDSNSFSVLGQSLRGFIGFFHLSNNFALFGVSQNCIYFETAVAFISITCKSDKASFPFLLVTLDRDSADVHQCGSESGSTLSVPPWDTLPNQVTQ